MDAPHAPEPLQDIVRRARSAKGLTQLELADAVGMSQRWVSDLEAGDIARPRPRVVTRLADVLSIDVADLYVAMNQATTKAEARRIAEAAPDTNDDPALHVVMSGARTVSPKGLRMIADYVELIRRAEEGAVNPEERDAPPDR